MKQLISILLALSIYFASNAQILLTIEGKVLQKSDSLPIFNAHIYIEGNQIGTTSNENGEFSIHFNSEFKEKPIVVSIIGFSSTRVTFNSNGKLLIVYLEEDELILESVTITPVDPEQILLNVANNIKRNYPQEKFSKELYYKEAISVNNKPIRYLEIVADFVGEGFSSKKKNPYKYDLFIKEKRPGFNIDSTFEGGNGIGVLHWLKGTKQYLQKSNFKYFNIELVGYSNYRNNEVFKLLITSKGVKKTVTTMFITTDTYALIAINRKYEDADRTVPESMFYFTKWYEYVDFVQLNNGSWYINSINDFRESIDVKGDMTEMKRLIRLTKINDEHGFKEKNRIARETDLYTYPIQS
ncbi:MAG: carboxypeptidase-like regulatory domain-containing protein [Cyclobacteriaceae bacterium]|nr:carboxypeptidase-like regulatory domain-containing protein [Cyclobacteriaceae bacterium]